MTETAFNLHCIVLDVGFRLSHPQLLRTCPLVGE